MQAHGNAAMLQRAQRSAFLVPDDPLGWIADLTNLSAEVTRVASLRLHSVLDVAFIVGSHYPRPR